MFSLNTVAQMGDGTVSSRPLMTKIDNSRLHPVDQFVLFDAVNHALAVTIDNELLAWGTNERFVITKFWYFISKHVVCM